VPGYWSLRPIRFEAASPALTARAGAGSDRGVQRGVGAVALPVGGSDPAPGGVLFHISVHPCFCGGFADHTDSEAIVIRPGYLDSYWTKQSWTD